MPIQTFGGLPDANWSKEELVDHVGYLQKTVEYYMDGNLDTSNAKEFGGWYIGKDQIAAKNMNVGLSSKKDGSMVRIWAGTSAMDAAPFRVYENGKIIAEDGEFRGKITALSGTIGGWTITPTMLYGNGIIMGGMFATGQGFPRIEIYQNYLRTYNASGQLEGFNILPAQGGGNAYGDVTFYDGGIRKFGIYNDLTGYTLFSTNGASLSIGNSSYTYAYGTWIFRNGIDMDQINGLYSELATLDGRIHTVSQDSYGYYLSNLNAIMNLSARVAALESG